MFFKKKKRSPVSCPVSVLFEIIQADLDMEICCSIDFIYKDIKHTTGVWGDNGETRKNIKYYLDKEEFLTINDLQQCRSIDNIPFFSLTENVTVTECDACYPYCTPQLQPYCKE